MRRLRAIAVVGTMGVTLALAGIAPAASAATAQPRSGGIHIQAQWVYPTEEECDAAGRAGQLAGKWPAWSCDPRPDGKWQLVPVFDATVAAFPGTYPTKEACDAAGEQGVLEHKWAVWRCRQQPDGSWLLVPFGDGAAVRPSSAEPVIGEIFTTKEKCEAAGRAGQDAGKWPSWACVPRPDGKWQLIPIFGGPIDPSIAAAGTGLDFPTKEQCDAAGRSGQEAGSWLSWSCARQADGTWRLRPIFTDPGGGLS